MWRFQIHHNNRKNGLVGPVVDGHRVGERVKRGIKDWSQLLPRVVNVQNAQRSDMEIRNERDESLVQGNGKSPLHVLRKDLAEFIRAVRCRSVIAVP
jgi:hypothetical protein